MPSNNIPKLAIEKKNSFTVIAEQKKHSEQ